MATFEYCRNIVPQLTQSIGSGSFGKVYYDKKYNMAIKVFRPGDEKITSKEVANMVELTNIVLDHKRKDIVIPLIGHDNKLLISYKFMAMEYCDGGTLYNIINMRSQTERKYYNYKCFKMIDQIICGINFLHENNIVHLDLKPDNILISNNNIKISDFGSAFILPSKHCLCISMMTTNLYASPDYFLGSYNPFHLDVWSLGIIIFQLLTAKNPWNTAKLTDHMFKSWTIEISNNLQLSGNIYHFNNEYPEIYQYISEHIWCSPFLRKHNVTNRTQTSIKDIKRYFHMINKKTTKEFMKNQ